jgi:hypothetical protein
MSTKQLLVVNLVVALVSAAVAVVLTSDREPEPAVLGPIGATPAPVALDPVIEQLERASLLANEAAAIATLRAITSAEAQAMAAGIIDTDGDGQGEYAYLSELAGTKPPRTSSEVLVPPILTPELGNVDAKGVATRNGYHFRVFLPSRAAGARSTGLAEGGRGTPDGEACEVLWCAYAWPVQAGKTGARAFFVSQEGDLLETPNADSAYSSEVRGPAFDAALCNRQPRDMGAENALADGCRANDGRAWALVGS